MRDTKIHVARTVGKIVHLDKKTREKSGVKNAWDRPTKKEERSVSRAREKITCKEQPKSRKSKGGQSRPYIPWCK